MLLTKLGFAYLLASHVPLFKCSKLWDKLCDKAISKVVSVKVADSSCGMFYSRLSYNDKCVILESGVLCIIFVFKKTGPTC